MVSQRLATFRFQVGHGLQKAAGVGMCRRTKDFMPCAELDYAAGIHHGHAVGDLRNHGEIVRDEEHGQAKLGAQFCEQCRGFAPGW